MLLMIKSPTFGRRKKAIKVGGILLIVGLVGAGLVWYFANSQPTLNSEGQSAPTESVAPTGASADKAYRDISSRTINDSDSDELKGSYYGDLGEAAIAAGECQAATDAATDLVKYNSVRALSIQISSVECFMQASNTAAAKSVLAEAERNARAIEDAEDREDALGLINMKANEIGQ